MIHKPVDRDFFLIGGNVLKSGYSLNLAKGQIGLFDLENPTKNGLMAVSNITGYPKNKEYVLRMGSDNSTVSRTSNSKASSTYQFKLNEVLDVRVSAPTSSSQIVDNVVLGYDGVNASTAIKFKKGDRKTVFMKLSGNWIGLLGYPDNFVTVEYTMEADSCSPLDECVECDGCMEVNCAPMVFKAVEYLKNFELRGGVKVSDGVEITPVKSCTTSPTFVETNYDFYSLIVSDIGDDNALALVQAQYPLYQVNRIDRSGTKTTYQIVAPQGTVVAAYTQSIASVLKGCATCPAGYSAVAGGVLYNITLEDDGVDNTALVQAIPNAVAGTALKNGQNSGVGTYSVLLSQKLISAQITTFVTANKTSTVDELGLISAICTNGTITSVAWTVTSTCKMSEASYKLTLPDTECGTNRLAELQAAYPNNTVALSGTSKKTITLTGTSGTGNIAVAGVNYLTTFNTDLTTTASNFVTTNAAAILAATGAVVTSVGAVITITDNTIYFPTITFTNLTLTLGGTVSGLVAVGTVTGGCQTEYTIIVPTNIVCDECSPIYKDIYKAEEPRPYDIYKWETIDPSPSYSDCLCGIKFKGKEFIVCPDEFLRDELAFEESSVMIEVSGGYVTEVREGIDNMIESPMKVTYLSKWQPRTHLGGNLWTREDESRNFFTGESKHNDTLVSKMLAGDTSHIESCSQYVDIAIDIRRNQYSQGMTGTAEFTNTYHIFAEYGRHADAIGLANLIAAGAGLPAVGV